MDKQEKETLMRSLRANRELLSGYVLPDEELIASAALLPSSKHLSPDDLREKLSKLAGIDAQTKMAASGHGFAKMPPIKEIFMLLKDLYQGKVNDYIQEIISGTQVELNVVNPNPGNKSSPNELEIKIKVAATVVDKYSNLLQMVLGQKTIGSKETEIIREAGKVLNLTTSGLRQVNLVYSTLEAKKNIQEYMAERRSSGCFTRLFGGPDPLVPWLYVLTSLSDRGFAELEVAGGISWLSRHTAQIRNKNDRDIVEYELRQLATISQLCTEDISSDAEKAFLARVVMLRHIDWPPAFAREAEAEVTSKRAARV
jgi:hypothetical protein